MWSTDKFNGCDRDVEKHYTERDHKNFLKTAMSLALNSRDTGAGAQTTQPSRQENEEQQNVQASLVVQSVQRDKYVQLALEPIPTPHQTVVPIESAQFVENAAQEPANPREGQELDVEQQPSPTPSRIESENMFENILQQSQFNPKSDSYRESNAQNPTTPVATEPPVQPTKKARHAGPKYPINVFEMISPTKEEKESAQPEKQKGDEINKNIPRRVEELSDHDIDFFSGFLTH
ncbi:Oidioi.mRNA.OKI2018_I69.YSR.g17039.t1.cds [Oikopleura dioica]|uniref:Oidioi.mRNA.OKI2018_I69.YSR.g17039.t1.cds n=1 Tax=Oikopleura dioica TaxID=34765 RepID=A0ABN7SMN0_OIKDI|nr:Oidioi.mRNA.OKI2018_I69.YSR.g17039.t1.cds [Oikopleura dioica]